MRLISTSLAAGTGQTHLYVPILGGHHTFHSAALGYSAGRTPSSRRDHYYYHVASAGFTLQKVFRRLSLRQRGWRCYFWKQKKSMVIRDLACTQWACGRSSNPPDVAIWRSSITAYSAERRSCPRLQRLILRTAYVAFKEVGHSDAAGITLVIAVTSAGQYCIPFTSGSIKN